MSVVALLREDYFGRFRNPRSQACVASASVVVSDPLREDLAELSLAQRMKSRHSRRTVPTNRS
jgi:hypothetical protein